MSMQEQLEALEHQIANAMKMVKSARSYVKVATDNRCTSDAIERMKRNLCHCEGRLEGLRAAYEIMMLVGTEE